MTTINRYVVPWTGTTALPGVSVFYSTGATDATADLVTFFTAIKSAVPTGTSWSILNSGDTLDDTSGILTGGWTGTGGAVVSANGTGNYAAGVGGYINWQTGVIVNKRRLKGRTFICPLTVGQYDSNGTLISGALTQLGGAATTLATAGKMRVWHRPKKGTFSGGSSSLIISGTVPDQVTSLKTRRH